MRAMRPMRVRYNEVLAHKRMLASWLRDSEAIRDGIAVLAQALTGQLDDYSVQYLFTYFIRLFLFIKICFLCANLEAVLTR